MPKDLFTISSFVTLSGLVGLTYAVTNGLAQAFGWRQTWLGLVVALTCTELGVWSTGTHAPMDYLVGMGNGFLVFLAAGGTAQAVITGVHAADARTLRPQSADDASILLKPPTVHARLINSRFLSSWF